MRNHPVTLQDIDKLAILRAKHERASLSRLARLWGRSKPTTKKYLTGDLMAKPEKQNGASGILRSIFEELARQRQSDSRVARQLLRDTHTIANWRMGRTQPQAFELECLASLAGFRLRLEKEESSA